MPLLYLFSQRECEHETSYSLGSEVTFVYFKAKLLGELASWKSRLKTIRLGEVERTQAQQEIYIKEGKSKTNNSMHLKRCAADLYIFKNGEWLQSKTQLQSIGDYWETLDKSNKWGGNFKNFIDTPHFERQC